MATTASSLRFPARFHWGVATAALQIEGAARQDGRGESIWDRFSAAPGRIASGDTPATACDHYHRYRQDCALMEQLGVRNYRFSVAWPRLFPDGGRQLNQRGLDFYRRLLDELLRRGITPWATLYHWDLPQALEDRGGWAERTTVDAFRYYADAVVQGLSGQVKHWLTLNEIPTFIGHGYRHGIHAPGRRESETVVAQCLHHALLAHGSAVRSVREHGGRGAAVGLAHDLLVPIPVTETAADIAAAEAELAARNCHLLGPLFTGRYDRNALRKAGRPHPDVQSGDLSLISEPMDFLGLNIYAGDFVQARGRGREVLAFPPAYPTAGLDWLRLTPQAIYWGLRHCHACYRPAALYITENGAGYDEPEEVVGELNDLHRRDYLRTNLLHAHRATAEGIPCRGYFAWSLLDNFEWAEGYAKRFGLVHVNFRTQKRSPKLSARWFSRVMKENRVL